VDGSAARGLLGGGLRGTLAAIGDVVADAVVEQHRILRDDADSARSDACVTERISCPSMVMRPDPTS
jgi:hypothetical protein